MKYVQPCIHPRPPKALVFRLIDRKLLAYCPIDSTNRFTTNTVGPAMSRKTNSEAARPMVVSLRNRIPGAPRLSLGG